MNPAILKEWLKLTDQTRRNIFSETSAAIGLPDAAIEKDWWVVHTIELLIASIALRLLRFVSIEQLKPVGKIVYGGYNGDMADI